MNLFIILFFLVFCFCIGLYGDRYHPTQDKESTEQFESNQTAEDQDQSGDQIEPNQPENQEIEEKGTLDPWFEKEDNS
jgi:hypothetical protein